MRRHGHAANEASPHWDHRDVSSRWGLSSRVPGAKVLHNVRLASAPSPPHPMLILYSTLDWLLLGYLFWPIAIVPILIAYYVVSSVTDEEASGAAALLLAIAGFALFYRCPHLRPTSAAGWAWLAGGYVATGFALSLYKWFAVLLDFRKRDVKGDIARYRADEDARNPHNHDKARLNDAAGDLRRRDYKQCNVKVEDGQIVIYPNWRAYPIATWTTYWPFFALSVVFDPIKRGIEHMVKWLRGFYDWVAARFAVRG